jgi:uncharacterized membrane protein
MTQNNVNNNEYRIDDPKYIDPSYNIKYFNKLLKDENVTNHVPDKLLNHVQQYSNNVNVNTNYKNDLYVSTGLLKYLDSYKSKPTPNNAYNERHINANKYYIMKYQSETHILKLIIFFCGLSLIGSFFFLKGLISQSLYILYLGFIISIALIIIIYNIYILIYRDTRRFDEYDFGYMATPGDEGDNSPEETDDDKNIKTKCD